MSEGVSVCPKCGGRLGWRIIGKGGMYVRQFECEGCGFKKEIPVTTKDGKEWR